MNTSKMAKHQWLSHCCSVVQWWIVGHGIQKVHTLTPNSQNGIQKWHAPSALTSLQSSLKLSKALKFGRRCRPMWPAVPIMGYCFILLENRKSMILSFSVKVHLNFRFFFDSCVSDFKTRIITKASCRLQRCWLFYTLSCHHFSALSSCVFSTLCLPQVSGNRKTTDCSFWQVRNNCELICNSNKLFTSCCFCDII